MQAIPRTSVNFEKITGPYALLSVFLVVAEGTLALLIFRAESATERVIFAVLMAVIFVIFLWIVRSVTNTTTQGQIKLTGLPTPVTPAETEVTKEEVQALIARQQSQTTPPKPSDEAQTNFVDDKIGAPDGSYLIKAPPRDWRVRVMSWAETASESLQLDIATIEQMLANNADPTLKDRLVHEICAPRIIKLTPVPGQTLIDGRKIPTVLSFDIKTRLAMFVKDRVLPPFFIERTFQHNVMSFVNELITTVPYTLQVLKSDGVLLKTQRRAMWAELTQKVENAVIDGKEHQNIQINCSVIGIEGDLRDYIIVMTYPTSPDDTALFSEEREILNSLVSSFQPIKLGNIAQQEAALRRQADEFYHQIIENRGENIFSTEFGFQILRMKNWDLKDPDTRLQAIKQFKSFELMAKEVKYEDEELDQLWEALHRAEQGDATEFRESVESLIEAVNDSAGASAGQLEAPPSAPPLPPAASPSVVDTPQNE